MARTQTNRVLSVTTPLGTDVLLLSSFSGSEAMSRLFSYQLLMVSETQSIAAKDIVGKHITWQIQYLDMPPRYFNGYVSRFAAGELSPRGLRSYRAEVVPWLWFLTRTADCRIFNTNQSAPEIITSIFDELGFKGAYQTSVSQKPKREYCVQYRETDFNFVSRLMEEEGIYYYFQHDNGEHTLVMSDKSTYKDLPSNPWNPGQEIETWEHQFEFRPGKWTRTDYNFETPSTNLLTTSATTIDLPDAKKFEMFDYPGDYRVKGDGTTGTDIRMQEDQVPYEVVTATSECPTFTPGGQFKLDGSGADDEQGKEYVVTSIQHTAIDTDFESSDQQSGYQNSFHCIPAAVTFQPGRLTPKPFIAGVQTAVVVGKAGEEIYTDRYGRVRVQFFWDRIGKSDEKSSCWIRVAQVAAGERWGASFWPRIGQEVVVEFLEGDPDRPLIVGSVYNADQMPPYIGGGFDSKHKDDNKVSGFKSNSTKGGAGYNEWRFDDTQGKEQIFINAMRNMDVRVLNDSMESVLNNEHITVGGGQSQSGNVGNYYEKVFADRHIHILGNHQEQIEGNQLFLVGKGSASNGGNVDISIQNYQKELIGGNYDLHVKTNLTVGVDAAEDLTVGGDKKESIKGASHLHVTGDFMEKVDGGVSLTVASNQQIKAGGNHAVNAAQQIHLIGGTTVTIEATTQLTLKVGGNFVVIGPSGVTIVGTMVMINSGGAAGSGCGSSPTAPTDAKAVQDAADAQPVDPVVADNSKTGNKSAPG
jgi:type VI secretion system secreted protein VgrG